MLLPLAQIFLPLWAFLPLALYILALDVQTIVSAMRSGLGASLYAFPLLVMTHVLYGLGFWKGLFTKLESHTKAAVEVALEKIQG